MGASIDGGTPKIFVSKFKIPSRSGWFGGTPILGYPSYHHSIWILYVMLLYQMGLYLFVVKQPIVYNGTTIKHMVFPADYRSYALGIKFAIWLIR